MTRANAGHPALFEAPPPPRAPAGGKVYQGVCKQIRALFPEKDPDPKRAAEAKARKATLQGTIAQARELARRIDLGADGAVGTAALHDTLDKLLERLAPINADSDPFQELLNRLEDNDGKATHAGDPATPHPTV